MTQKYRKCKCCNNSFKLRRIDNWFATGMCKTCEHIAFHLRNVMPSYIPKEQTLKYLKIYKKRFKL